MRRSPSEMTQITVFTDNKAACDIVEAEKPTFSGVEGKAALEVPHLRILQMGLPKFMATSAG
eukprot:762795-Amphidinium_carterae.2